MKLPILIIFIIILSLCLISFYLDSFCTFSFSSRIFEYYLLDVRGLFGKYRAYLYISALALFFIIGWVASFKVIPTWLNNTVPAMFLLLETALKLTFWNGLQLARRITLNRLDVIEPLSFELHFQFWKHQKVAGSYVGTVRRLSKQCDTVFTQKLLHKIR